MKTTQVNWKTYIIFFGLGLMILSPLRAESYSPLPGFSRAASNRMDKLLEDSKELQMFFKGKEYVFKREWEHARSQLARYIKTYPKGQLVDEALYWLAQSLNRISQTADGLTRIVTFKEDAIQRLRALAERYPDSLWKDDAESLRAKIVGELALLGKKEYEAELKALSLVEDKSISEIKLVALSSLIGLEPVTAFQALQHILTNEKDIQIRKKAMFLLGSYFNTPEAVALLRRMVAEKDTDPEIVSDALSWIKRIAVRNIPVHLNYFAFAARLADKSQYGRFPENKVNIFELPRNSKGSAGAARKSCDRFFKGGLTDFKSAASSRGVRGATDVLQARSMSVAHKLNDIRIGLLYDSIDKTAVRITGKFSFKDLKKDKEHIEEFTVADEHDLLLAMRRGDTTALVVVQFESTKGESTPDESVFVQFKSTKGGSSSDELAAEPGREGLAVLNAVFGTDKNPLFSTEYSSVMGCRVLTTSQSTSMTMPKKGGQYDFAFARAEIPSDEGTWELTGHLLGLKDEGLFRGRMAVLINPSGRIVALANQITVPVKNPGDYKAEGSRLDDPKALKLLPSGGGLTGREYPTSIKLDNNNAIFSSRSTFTLDELKGDIVVYGESRARLQGKGGTWILSGRLMYDSKNKVFTALDAVLQSPDGRTAASAAEMTVPLSDPSAYKIIKK